MTNLLNIFKKVQNKDSKTQQKETRSFIGLYF